MSTSVTISLAQCNFTVGDIQGNKQIIIEAFAEAEKNQSDLVIFPEMAITGYPAEDLWLRSAFITDALDALDELVALTKDSKCAMLVGGPWRTGRHVYNSAFLIEDGLIKSVVHKRNLPNYGVFDEKRLFEKGDVPRPITFKGISLGVMICEDMWNNKVAEVLFKQGAELLISINASPYERNKFKRRMQIAERNVTRTHIPLIYCNMVGAQDELVFDGNSFILDAKGDRICQLDPWQETLLHTTWQHKKENWVCKTKSINEETDTIANIYQASMVGLRDYIEKNNFPGVLVGLSGGIDSALTATLAVDALGADRVHLIGMPSRYTSDASLKDGKKLADTLGTRYDIISIEPIFESFLDSLKESFEGTESDLTEENLQSRIRGTILMAQSNKFGYLVLSTGNKSEMAVGYATLYGDMNGGFNPIKDIYKTEVFELCKWRNKHQPVGALGKKGTAIPKSIITKVPSAELREDQTDQDSLPPYDILDDILIKLIEKRRSVEDVVDSGHEFPVVEKVANLILRAEYKRRQSPPGVKISEMAFGRDRRYPITNKYKF